MKLPLLAPLASPLVAVAVSCLAARLVSAQSRESCGTDRALSALVGAGLGGAVGAIPATIAHRHDQTTSHRIVAVTVGLGAAGGFLVSGRDRPCVSHADPVSHPSVVATRGHHAARGAVTGAIVGAVLGAAGGTLYNVGCVRDPCHAREEVIAFSAGEGALAVGLLGSLIGWAWPVRR